MWKGRRFSLACNAYKMAQAQPHYAKLFIRTTDILRLLCFTRCHNAIAPTINGIHLYRFTSSNVLRMEPFPLRYAVWCVFTVQHIASLGSISNGKWNSPENWQFFPISITNNAFIGCVCGCAETLFARETSNAMGKTLTETVGKFTRCYQLWNYLHTTHTHSTVYSDTLTRCLAYFVSFVNHNFFRSLSVK